MKRSGTPTFRAALTALALCISLTAPVYATGLISGDLDHDDDVDMGDSTIFVGCLSGAAQPHNGTLTCQESDIDHDGDVDISDFGSIQACFTGPGVPGDPYCGGCVLPRKDRSITASPSQVTAGQSSYIAVANTQEGATYQLRNNANNANIGSSVAGTGGGISLSTGILTSTTTFNVLATNSIKGCSAALTATATVTVVQPSPLNKIGVHTVIGSRNGFGPFLDTCRTGGKPVAVIKCVDDFGAAWEAKIGGKSPQSLTMGRINKVDGQEMGNLSDKVSQAPAQVAAWYYSKIKPKWQLDRQWIDVWETLNEMSSDWAWQADFYIAMMDLAEPDGYRLANWGASVGNPPESAYYDIARTCLRAKDHGNHVLTLHEYGFFETLLQDSYALHKDAQGYGQLVLRYRKLYNYLAQQNAVVPLVLSEVGQGGGYNFVGTSLFVQDFGWYDARMREDAYVIGCAAWTLGTWGNGASNFQDALPALANYIIAH